MKLFFIFLDLFKKILILDYFGYFYLNYLLGLMNICIFGKNCFKLCYLIINMVYFVCIRWLVFVV